MINQAFWQTIDNYDEEVFGIFRHKLAAKPVIDFLQQHSREAIVADLGCGVGQAFPYLQNARQLYAIDSSAVMLEHAKQVSYDSGQTQIQFIETDLATYQLPEKTDLSLMLSSFFPAGMGHAIRILSNVQANSRSGGKVLMVVPALEALQYWFHLTYRRKFEEQRPEVEINMELKNLYSQILTYGYYHSRTGKALGQIVKYWIKEELLDLLHGMRFKNIKVENHLLPWEIYFPNDAYWCGHHPMWFWRVTMINP